MLDNLKQFLFRWKYVFVSFLITWLTLAVFAKEAGLAPFGEKCLLSMDLYGQYYPMMAEKLSDFFSVWSWNGGLGFPSIPQSAYYTNSLFLLLLSPFSGSARIVALHTVLFLKLSLSAAAFTFYLGKKFERYDIFTAVLGVCYGLSAYCLAYMNQPMWLDIVLLLPLILHAMEWRLLAVGDPIPYTLLLALAIYSNFYISFALCLFLVLWFVVCSLTQKQTFRLFIKGALKFAGASVAAGLLCAFMLFPLLCHMENWISSSLDAPEVSEWYHTLSEITDSFSADAETSLSFGPANVFCGSASLFFLLLFVLHTEIPLKKRISLTALAVLMFVSFEWNRLDYIWHGFHFPNQLPARQSFLFVFVILLIAYEALTRLQSVYFPFLVIAGVTSCGFLLYGIAESANAEGRLSSVKTVAAISVLAAIILVLKKMPRGVRWMKTAVALVLIADICSNAVFVLNQYMRVTNTADYVKHEEQMLAFAEKYESGEDDFYRMETTPVFTFDPGQLYGYKGISYYASTMNGNTYHLMKKLGNRVYAKNVSTVYMPTPFQDMMFGVKYHYMRGRTLAYANRLEKMNGITVYESPYALPVAYAVESNIKNIESSALTGFRFQEKFIGLAANMKKRLISAASTLDVRISNGYQNGGYLIARDVESAVRYTVELAVAREGYFFLEFDFTVGNYEISVNGGEPRMGSCGADPILDFGLVCPDDIVTVTVTTRGYEMTPCGIRGYIVEDFALEEAYEKLSAGALQVEYASDTQIRGEITVEKDCVLYASIPAENGWEVYIDGEKREIYDLGMGLIFCDIEAGTHTVEYRYRAPGLARGVVISSVTAVGVIAWAVLEARRREQRIKNKE